MTKSQIQARYLVHDPTFDWFGIISNSHRIVEAQVKDRRKPLLFRALFEIFFLPRSGVLKFGTGRMPGMRFPCR